ncbi:MAG: hypothetical protein QOG12_862, partial [Verrucomicrobiota bacterium]
SVGAKLSVGSYLSIGAEPDIFQRCALFGRVEVS